MENKLRRSGLQVNFYLVIFGPVVKEIFEFGHGG